MSRRLAGAAVEGSARSLSIPDPALDAFTRQRVEAAEAVAYQEGLVDGRRAATQEAAAAASAASAQAAAAVSTAVDQAVGELRALRDAEALADVTLARELAEIVLGREPHDDAQALLARCRVALGQLDDRPLELRCHPDDAATLRDGMVSADDLTVVDDPGLATGEATIAGRWACVELTRDAAWSLIAEAIDAGEDGRG